MRKLYLALIAAMFAISANADIYVFGNLNGKSNWDNPTESPYVLKDVAGDGVFTGVIEITTDGVQYFRIYDNVKNLEHRPQNNTEDVDVTNGYDYWTWNISSDTNQNKSFKITNKGSYRISCSAAGNDWKIAVEPVATAADLYIHGDFYANNNNTKNWSDGDKKVAANKFEYVDGKYILNVTFEQRTGYFRIFNGNNEFGIESNTTVSNGGDFDALKDKTAGCYVIEPGKYTFTVTPNGQNFKLNVAKQSTSTAPAALYLSCDATNEGWKFGFDMTKDGNKFTTTLDVTANYGWVTFSTNKVSGWNDDFGTLYGSTENNLPPVMGTAYDMEAGSGNCWKLGNGTYTITVDFSGANPTVTFTTGTPVPVEKTYTIYYYDQQARGSITVRIWDEGDQHHREEAMTPTGKYVYDGTNYWPAYSYTFTTTNIPAYVRFKDITGDLVFTNGAFYTHNRTYPSNNYQLVDRRDDDYVYLYFNFCEDWLTKYDKNFVPHCHVYNKTTGAVLHPNGWATDVEAMTNVRYQIWEYKVPANRIDEFNDAIFYVKNRNDDKYTEYRASFYEGYENPETATGEWDAANWTKYIYAPVINGDQIRTRQTYLTYSQFTALDATRRQNLYLLGQGGGLPSWDIAIFDKGLTENLNWFKEDNGVFYIPLSFPNGGQAKFKLSWINPHDARVNNNYGESNNLRMWGTFDLGLIGVDDLSELFDNGTLDKSYIGCELVDDNGNKSTNNCLFTLRTSLPYNNYNQFDWVVDTQRTNLTPGNYWIVVDTHAECRTLTMISFDPNPSISVKAGEITSHDISFAKGAQIHSAEDHLLASANNGHQVYNRVNIASGSAEITAAASDAFSNEFDVEYSILMNGEQVLLIDYSPGSITLDYLPAAQNVTAGVRATYTNHRTGLTFHSRTGLGTITGGSELAAPQIGINTAKHLTGNNPVDGVHNVHAVVMAEYTAPETEFANFVDFEANAEGITDAILIDKNNDWVNDFDEFKYLGQDYDAADWTRNDDLNSFGYEHCWAALIRDSKQLPFYLPNVKQVTSLEDITATDVNVTAYAVYPFLINPRLNVHPQGAPRRAAAARISIPEDLSGYNVVTIPVPATTSAVIPAGALTGISDIAADTDADAEYFTLQGVRVQGELAPGVYIRRMGNKADKVYIR